MLLHFNSHVCTHVGQQYHTLMKREMHYLQHTCTTLHAALLYTLQTVYSSIASAKALPTL